MKRTFPSSKWHSVYWLPRTYLVIFRPATSLILLGIGFINAERISATLVVCSWSWYLTLIWLIYCFVLAFSSPFIIGPVSKIHLIINLLIYTSKGIEKECDGCVLLFGAQGLFGNAKKVNRQLYLSKCWERGRTDVLGGHQGRVLNPAVMIRGASQKMWYGRREL